MLWTEHGIRKVARDVVEALLREGTATRLGAELPAEVERRAEEAKTTLQRKLSAIYSIHVERLKQRLAQMERDLEESAPAQQRRLKEFEDKLDQVQASSRRWLDEPRRDLVRAVEDQRKQFITELDDLRKAHELRARATAKHLEARTEKLIDTRLQELLLTAVREHVRSTPFDRGILSNKQLAAAKGMSLRAVKRLRRAGLA